MTLPRTPSQTVGPFFTIGLCRPQEREAARPGEPGAVRLVGAVLDGDGQPIDDAVVEVWDGAGRWGRAGTDAEGRYELTIAKPAARDGQAPHLEAYVFARGLLRHQRTRIYFPDEEDANAADPVLSSLNEGERATLVAQSEDGALRFEIRMQGERQTVFFAV